MGTSKERIKDEEEGNEMKIPWAFVDHPVRQELIRKLNPDAAVSGNDWRMLASELGYCTSDIRYIESEKDINTRVLFNQYDTKPGASVNDVYRALEKMEREDCLEIIRNALPGIKQAFLQSRNNEPQMLHVAETSEMYASRGGPYQWSNSQQCPCPYSHHPTSAYGSHSFYPCSHGFSGCSHHLGGSCSSPCQAHLPHPSPAMCQTANHSNTFEKKCSPGFSSSPCHTVPLVTDYTLKSQQPCCVTQPCGSSSPSHRENSHSTSSNYMSEHHGCSSLSPGHSGYHGSPTYNYTQNMNNMTLPNNISALDNSNLMSSDSSNSDSLSTRQKVARQYSDECNITQAPSGDKRFRHNSNTGRGTVDERESADRPSHFTENGMKPRNSHSPKFAHPSETGGYGDHRGKYYQQKREAAHVRNSPGSFSAEHSLDVNDHMNSNKTSLAHLEKLATVPNKFMPTDEYKRIVAEQKIETGKHSRDGKGSLDSSSSHSSSSGSSSGKSHPSTFPMRVKAKQHERGMEDLKNLTISKKSTSMPKNMKPVEYRKAFRHIKVFVTYSFDDENHGKQVLSLCKFLQSNGFACCVDVTKKKTTGDSLEQLEWCKKKVTEADFVLVCISQKYLEDISSPQAALMAKANDRPLHTREIYELMNSEYLNSQHVNSGSESNGYSTPPPRFVPLLFSQMTVSHVPPWMSNGPAYMWPKHFKDLAWMLTKPQERIMGRRDVNIEHQERRNRGRNDYGTPMDMDDCSS